MKEKKIQKLLDFAELNDGYVSVAEAREKGIAQTYLCMAEEEGIFQKVCKGLYVKKGYEVDPFTILHFRYRKAVFASRSALFLHGILKEQPKELEVYLPRNYMTSGIEGSRSYHVSGDDFLLGIGLAVSPHGPLVPTYDKERAFLDVLRHYNRYEDEEYRSILSQAKSYDLDHEKLLRYADAFHVREAVEMALKGIW